MPAMPKNVMSPVHMILTPEQITERHNGKDIVVGTYESGGVIKFRVDKPGESWSIPGCRTTNNCERATAVAEAIYKNRVLADKIGYRKVAR